MTFKNLFLSKESFNYFRKVGFTKNFHLNEKKKSFFIEGFSSSWARSREKLLKKDKNMQLIFMSRIL